MSLFGKVVAVVTAKGALGLVVGVLAVSAAGMAGEASLTGSMNPMNWGQQVVQQVNKCKESLASGERGIGQCVSAFAKTHGQQVASGARENPPTPKPKSHGNGHSQGQGNGNGKSQGNGNGHGQGGGPSTAGGDQG